MSRRQRFFNLGVPGLVMVGLCLAYQPVLAHHSGTGFSRDEVKEIKGTIKEFQFKNPHSWIQVDVENADGEIVEWSVEWGSPNSLGRRGIRPSSFPVGAEVTMRIRPLMNGSPAGGFIGAKFADGSTLGNWEG